MKKLSHPSTMVKKKKERFLGFSLSSEYVMLLFAFTGVTEGNRNKQKKDPIRSFLQELKAFTVDYNTMG